MRVPVRNQSGLLPYWTYSLRRSVNRTMFDGSSVLVWYMYVCFGLVNVRVMRVVQTSMLYFSKKKHICCKSPPLFFLNFRTINLNRSFSIVLII